jgi:phosphopantetheinyl transferase
MKMDVEGLHLEFVPLSEELPSLEARGYLAPPEELAYRSLSSPKRRRDWLAGRLAAKLALAKLLESRQIRRALNEIEIGNDLEGRPVWRLSRPDAVPEWPISITHSGGLAAVAVHTDAARLGFDLESVEERHSGWLDIAFHEEERGEARSPEAATRMWTVKEAALKVLGIGLRADLWDVRVGGGQVRLFGRALQRHRELGSPEIIYSTSACDNAHVMTVAYTRGTPGLQDRNTRMGDFAWIR